MGTIEQGFLGGFNGKLGTAVGAKWKGINVIRSRPPRKRTGKPSDSQLEVQAKFTLMTNFLRPLADLLDDTFKKTAVGMTGVNKAFAENKRAVTGTAPNFTVDYPKVFLSTGSLPGIVSPVLTSPTAGKLQLAWTDNTGKKKNALSSDLLFVTAYSPDLDEWEFVEDAVARNAGTFTMDLTEFSGKTVQTYVGVFTADGKTVSDSQFTGAVAIL
jgi:hypothetical protein